MQYNNINVFKRNVPFSPLSKLLPLTAVLDSASDDRRHTLAPTTHVVLDIRGAIEVTNKRKLFTRPTTCCHNISIRTINSHLPRLDWTESEWDQGLDGAIKREIDDSWTQGWRNKRRSLVKSVAADLTLEPGGCRSPENVGVRPTTNNALLAELRQFTMSS